MQTKWVLQGDPISPLFLNIMRGAIIDITRNSSAMLIMYADDVIIGSKDKDEVQHVLNKFEKWVGENSLQINHQKKKQMVFRKGGKPSVNNTLTLLGKPLEIMPKFIYLGITLQTTSKSFRVHIQERVTAAIRTSSIKQLQQLSIKTAMTIDTDLRSSKALSAPLNLKDGSIDPNKIHKAP